MDRVFPVVDLRGSPDRQLKIFDLVLSHGIGLRARREGRRYQHKHRKPKGFHHRGFPPGYCWMDSDFIIRAVNAKVNETSRPA
jgi:hypothetical protein